MTSEDMLREINALPIETQRQIEDFIAFLRMRNKSALQAENAEADLASEEFIGIWRDREDLQDSTDWIHNTRQSHWRK